MKRFDEIVRQHQTEAAYYGHASVGCLHVRPLINLKDAKGLAKMASIGEQVTDLVLEFGGSLSGEHGDGIVRGVWTEKMFGSRLYSAFREVKRAFDPQGIMNPGKIIDCPPMTENLRYWPDYKSPNPPLEKGGEGISLYRLSWTFPSTATTPAPWRCATAWGNAVS